MRGRVSPPGVQLSDERLAQLVTKEGGAPFSVLYERYHQSLYRYCRSIVRDEHDAQEALQSTMANAFTALRRGQPEVMVRPWLFRIAHNEAISLLRRRRPQEILADEQTLAAPPEMSEPAAIVEQRQRLATLLCDLRSLTVRQRSVLLMRELSGLSTQEVAVALSSTPGAVKQTLFEARAALREQEEGRAMECEQVRRLICEDDGRALRGRRIRSHLRTCASCQELEETIATRRRDLMLLAPPLPVAAGSALLSRLLDIGAGGSVAGATSGGVGGAVANGSSLGSVVANGTAPSIAAHAGGAIAAKVLTTAAVVAAGAAGVAGVAGVSLSGSRGHDRSSIHHVRSEGGSAVTITGVAPRLVFARHAGGASRVAGFATKPDDSKTQRGGARPSGASTMPKGASSMPGGASPMAHGEHGLGAPEQTIESSAGIGAPHASGHSAGGEKSSGRGHGRGSRDATQAPGSAGVQHRHGVRHESTVPRGRVREVQGGHKSRSAHAQHKSRATQGRGRTSPARGAPEVARKERHSSETLPMAISNGGAKGNSEAHEDHPSGGAHLDSTAAQDSESIEGEAVVVKTTTSAHGSAAPERSSER